MCDWQKTFEFHTVILSANVTSCTPSKHSTDFTFLSLQMQHVHNYIKMAKIYTKETMKDQIYPILPPPQKKIGDNVVMFRFFFEKNR